MPWKIKIKTSGLKNCFTHLKREDKYILNVALDACRVLQKKTCPACLCNA